MSIISSLAAAAGSTIQNSTAGKTAHRPDASNLAALLFQSLDTSGKGYLQASDLQSALSTQASTATTAGSTNTAKTSSTSSTSGASQATSLFNALDTNGDGKLTKQELTDALNKIGQELSMGRQKHHMQISGASAGTAGAAAGATTASGTSPSTSLVGNLLHLLTRYASVAASATSAVATPAAVSVTA